jgi:hypothetical protein
MVHQNAASAEMIEPESESGIRVRGQEHPLLSAIACAPLDPISDEENALLDEITQTTSHWLSTEEFVASIGIGSAP